MALLKNNQHIIMYIFYGGLSARYEYFRYLMRY